MKLRRENTKKRASTSETRSAADLGDQRDRLRARHWPIGRRWPSQDFLFPWLLLQFRLLCWCCSRSARESLCARDCSGSPVSHRPVPSHPPHAQPAVTIIPSQHCRAPPGTVAGSHRPSQNRSTVRERGRETSTPVPGVAALRKR